MSETSYNHTENRKREWVVLLLAAACLLAGILLWRSDPVTAKKLTSQSQLDSLITLSFNDFGITRNRLRTQTVDTGSLFSRKVYTVSVSSDFSKTFFHYHLQQDLNAYDVKTHGIVQFPEKHLRIHLLYNNTVHRTLVIRTDPLLNLNPDT